MEMTTRWMSNVSQPFFVPSHVTNFFLLEDGDMSCIMGYSHVSLRNWNVPHRIQCGWIPSSAITTMSFSCNSPTLKVSALSLSSNTGVTTVIKMPRSQGGYYYFSFRNTDGYDSLLNTDYANKLQIHYQVRVCFFYSHSPPS